MRDSPVSNPFGVRVEPAATGAGRRAGRDRIVGLLGVLFYGTWMIVFCVATVVMAAIVATGADNLARTILIAVLCAGFAVFNGWRLRATLRRLRGVPAPPAR